MPIVVVPGILLLGLFTFFISAWAAILCVVAAGLVAVYLWFRAVQVAKNSTVIARAKKYGTYDLSIKDLAEYTGRLVGQDARYKGRFEIRNRPSTGNIMPSDFAWKYISKSKTYERTEVFSLPENTKNNFRASGYQVWLKNDDKPSTYLCDAFFTCDNGMHFIFEVPGAGSRRHEISFYDPNEFCDRLATAEKDRAEFEKLHAARELAVQAANNKQYQQETDKRKTALAKLDSRRK